jgi:2-oxoglutarate ferredoxin oxidoreductase subunit alpha
MSKQSLPSAVVRFAGDSGDGIQVIGSLFTTETALAGSDLATLPNFPSEIRAPTGTTYGVSSFQIQFGSVDVWTPGDRLDALFAFNPAAVKTNVADLRDGGILIVNSDAFDARGIDKAGYPTGSDPLADPQLRDRVKVLAVDISTQVKRALETTGLSAKDKDRAKNFWALGLASWLYHRPLEPTVGWITRKFADAPAVAEGNRLALQAGWSYGETAELAHESWTVEPARLEPGLYRNATGNQSLAWGLIAAAQRAGKPLTYATYPITPATDILHELARHKNFQVRTMQMEDEIAAVAAAIGVSYGGGLGVTGTSGPGLALKGEAINLAVMTELPLVVVNVQRGGPSTGLPTKTEQTDLLQSLYGRNGESPVVVLAIPTPGEAFALAYEAVRLAVKYMVPVILLSDAYVANGSEPWRIPDVASLPPIDIRHPAGDGEAFQPYRRDDATLARPWAIPGTPGYTHRIGGIEKQDITGNVCYEPDNHHRMVELRRAKVERVRQEIPPLAPWGQPSGGLLVVGWGSTFGSIRAAVQRARAAGKPVSHLHLTHLNPLPADLGQALAGFDRVLVPEINSGQLRMLLRAEYLVDAVGFNRVRGLPLAVDELAAAIDAELEAL